MRIDRQVLIVNRLEAGNGGMHICYTTAGDEVITAQKTQD
jgi:hypothetical protein